MALSNDDLIIIVGAEGVQDFVRQMATVDQSGNKAFSSLEKGAKKSGGAFNELTNAVPRLGSAISALTNPITALTVGVGLLFSAWSTGVKKSADLSESLQNLKAITGASTEDLQFYREEAMRLGPTYLQSAEDVVKANKLVGSAKPELLSNKRALADVTEQVLLLQGAAKDLTTEQATKALTGVLNQWGLGAEYAAGATDILAASSKYGAVEIPNLTSAMLEFGPIAKTSNISIVEAAAAVETFGKAGLVGTKAGTQFKGVLLALEQQEKSLRPSVVGLGKAIENLGKKDLSTIELTKLFGRENVAAAQILLNDMDTLADLTEKLSTSADGTALAQFTDNTDTLNASLKRLSLEWDNTLIRLGEGSEGPLKDATDGLTDMLKNSDAMGKELSKNTDVISMVAGQFTDLAGKLGVVNPELSDGEKNMRLLGKAFNWTSSGAMLIISASREIAELIQTINARVAEGINNLGRYFGLKENILDQSAADELNREAAAWDYFSESLYKIKGAGLDATTEEIEGFKKTLSDFDPVGKSQAQVVEEMSARWAEYLKDVRVVSEVSNEALGPSGGLGAATQEAGHLSNSIAGLTDRLKALREQQKELDFESDQYKQLGDQITNLENFLKTKQGKFRLTIDEIELGPGAFNPDGTANLGKRDIVVPVKLAPAEGVESPLNMIGDMLGMSPEEMNTGLPIFDVMMMQITDLKTSFAELGTEIAGGFVTALGAAAAGSITFQEAIAQSMKKLAVEGTKLLGVFMLKTAVGLGFPAGIPFAAIGAGLLGLSGFLSGMFSAQGQANLNSSQSAPRFSSGGVSGGSGGGLSGQNISAQNNTPNIINQVFIGNEQVVGTIERQANKRRTRGGF